MDNQVQTTKQRYLQDKTPENEVAYIVALQRAGVKTCQDLTTVYYVKGKLTAECPSHEIPGLHPYLKDYKFRKFYDVLITSTSDAYTEVDVMVGGKPLWDTIVFSDIGGSRKMSLNNPIDAGKESIRLSLNTEKHGRRANIDFLILITEGPCL